MIHDFSGRSQEHIVLPLLGALERQLGVVEGEWTLEPAGPESECFEARHLIPRGHGFLTLKMGMTNPLDRAVSGFGETCVPALPRCTHNLIAPPCERYLGFKATMASPTAS